MNTSNVLGKGRTALVTGASRGIGPLIARRIASYGGHVVLTGRSAADLQAVTSDLTANGADVSFIPCDLTEPARRHQAQQRDDRPQRAAAADFTVDPTPHGRRWLAWRPSSWRSAGRGRGSWSDRTPAELR
jgi:NAD(P)-dependent dehydrogenase (short-subunit alcohol dehydrogenase family)